MPTVRGGSQAPYLKDDTKYPFCKDVVKGEMLIEFLPRREFPPWLTRTKYNKFLNRQYVPNWRCFISDVQCIAFSEHNSVKASATDQNYWALSIEHLIPLREQSDSRSHRLVNQVFVGRKLNQSIGHIPLALKLHHRTQLRNCDYDRNDYSSDNFYIVRNYIIEVEDQMKLGGKYPWQPWTYEDTKYKLAAEDFCDELKKVDQEFLSLNVHERYKWFDEFKWKW